MPLIKTYQVTSEQINKLVRELAEAVSESYLVDNNTLRQRDIAEIVEECLGTQD